MNETVKRKIEERLKALNMTQRELALKLGVNEVTVSRWLNGERSLTIETLDSIASALDTTASYLLADDSQPKGKGSIGAKEVFSMILGLVIGAVAGGLLSKNEKDKIVNALNGEGSL